MRNIYKDASIVGSPSLLAHVHAPIGVKVGNSADPFAMTLVVAPQP